MQRMIEGILTKTVLKREEGATRGRGRSKLRSMGSVKGNLERAEPRVEENGRTS